MGAEIRGPDVRGATTAVVCCSGLVAEGTTHVVRGVRATLGLFAWISDHAWPTPTSRANKTIKKTTAPKTALMYLAKTCRKFGVSFVHQMKVRVTARAKASTTANPPTTLATHGQPAGATHDGWLQIPTPTAANAPHTTTSASSLVALSDSWIQSSFGGLSPRSQSPIGVPRIVIFGSLSTSQAARATRKYNVSSFLS